MMDLMAHLAVHEIACWAMIATGLLTIVSLTTFVTAPYGRHSKGGWGLMVNPKLAWVLMECPNLVAVVYFYLKNYTPGTFPPATNCVLLAFYTGHYINRSLVFPLRMKGGKKMPVTVMLSALFYCSWNGFIQGKWLMELKEYEDETLSSARFILGSLVFVTGFSINYQSDEILRNLRKPGETGYKIPYGGAFRFVSCANFFGEIMEWTGYAIACNSLAGYAFAFYTFFNTAPRGASHHKWYLDKFGSDYERLGRKAVIPFIW